MIKKLLSGLTDLIESVEEITTDILLLKFKAVNAFIVEDRKENILQYSAAGKP